MGNKKNSEKMLKKIRIRLTDPHIPDSYVCEILESSLDGESECTALESIALENALRPIQDVKLKNYFEVLMSNECRKNLRINSADEDSKKFLQEKPINRSNGNKEKIQVKKVDSHCKQLRQDDSSDDETLFQIKKKCKFINGSLKSENTFNSKIINEIQIEDETEKIFDSPKTGKSDFIFKKHQNINILSYFSSTENSKETVQITEVNQPKKVGEVNQCKDKHINVVNIDEEDFPVKASKKDVKLAPLFIKKEKKVIDPEVQKARIDFLHKRLPPVKNCKSSKNLEFTEDFSSALHVQQRDDDVYWSKRNILLPFNVAPLVEIGHEIINSKTFRLEICRKKTINSITIKDSQDVSDGVIVNAESLRRLKSKYKNLNFDVVIDKLKQKQDKFAELKSKSTNEKSNSDKATADDLGFEALNTLWTDKYKPSSSEILGNESAVQRLKTWLQNWKKFDEELKSFAGSGKKKKEEISDDSESDYFVDSDEENHGLKAPCNVCLLSGPNGCGKTALVFALAEELEFNVVEMNSSSKRSGKNVQAYFQEATQSHKVHRVALPMVELNKQNQKKKRRRKEKTKKPIGGTKKSEDEGKDSKISLLLIEDADIVFEEKDDGFYAAIASLVQTSKRPFIFISNDPNYTLMDNLKTEKSLVLKMKYPSFYKSCAVLDVISLLEGKPANKKFVEFIVQRNHFDLRKSLLDLQLWSGCNTIANRSFDLGEFWWGSFNFLHHRNLRHLGETAGRERDLKRKRQSHLFDSTDDDDDDGVETEVKKFKQNSESKNVVTSASEVAKTKPNMRLYFEILDVMSTIDLIGPLNGEEPTPNRLYKVKDSLSLEEKTEDVDLTHEEMKKDLVDELINLSCRAFVEGSNFVERDSRKIQMEFPSWEEIRWRRSQEDARQELSGLLPLTNGTDSRSSHLDYLPVMRNICRTEKNRSIVNSKRKNRFSHYFNGSSELSEKNLEISQRVFSC